MCLLHITTRIFVDRKSVFLGSIYKSKLAMDTKQTTNYFFSLAASFIL